MIFGDCLHWHSTACFSAGFTTPGIITDPTTSPFEFSAGIQLGIKLSATPFPRGNTNPYQHTINFRSISAFQLQRFWLVRQLHILAELEEVTRLNKASSGRLSLRKKHVDMTMSSVQFISKNRYTQWLVLSSRKKHCHICSG